MNSMPNPRRAIRSLSPTIALIGLAVASCASGPAGEPESAEEALEAPRADGHAKGPGPERLGRGHGRGRGEGRLEELTEALDLTETQVAQIRAAFAERPAERREARAEMHERIAAILTPEQRVRFEALPVERRLQRLTERLSLNEQQVTQVRTILQEGFAQAKELRAQGDEARDAQLALRTRTRERIAAVLTAEQRATFEQMRDHDFGHGGRGRHGRGRRHRSDAPGGLGDRTNAIEPI